MLAKIFSKSNTLGIIFPNIYDELVPELVKDRSMASIPFASRYRLIDFTLSSMVNSGIEDIVVACQKNYHSLINHVENGREWDLSRRHGGLKIFPPYSESTYTKFNGRVSMLAGLLTMLRNDKHEYVVLTDNNYAANIDYREILGAYHHSGADVLCVYTKIEVPQSAKEYQRNDKGFYYTYEVTEDGQITKITTNDRSEGVKNFGINIYVVKKNLLVDLVEEADLAGKTHWERDILLPKMKAGDLKVVAHNYTGYVARIYDLKSYFDENMKLLEDENLDALFANGPIATKIRDDNPTRYIEGAVVENIMAGDGCVIEGEVKNSILFKGVKVAKGAKVENCILMQDTIVGPGCSVMNVITDKNVVIEDTTPISGPSSCPIYFYKGQHV